MLLAKYVTSPLKLYAGYEWIQFAPPSDPQTGFTNIAGLPMGAGFANGTQQPRLFRRLCGAYGL